MQNPTLLLPDGHEIVPIHFLCYPRTQDGRRELRIACQPNLKEFTTTPDRMVVCHRTKSVKSVTCPVCLDSAEWRLAESERRLVLGN